MKRLILALLAVVVLLAAIVLYRAATVESRQIAAAPAPPVAIDRDAAVQRLARAVQYRTVSHGKNVAGVAEHDPFVSWLPTAYPRVHASLQREIVNGRSLLYTWKGTDPKLAPVLLMGHYDVVPVEPGTESKWTRPPFSGLVEGGYVWGRGTLDDKSTVIGILEAAELLLAQNWTPKRTLLFAFGHDEEQGGEEGAAKIAALLQSRGVKLDAVLDEGGVISTGIAPGIHKPVALVGIAEKGIVSLELVAHGQGGHSSMPPQRTEIGAIATAVDRLQSRPFDGGVRGAAKHMFDWLTPEQSFGTRLITANLWLFEPLLKLQSKRSNTLNAMIRTTIAPTMIDGGVKDNVIPSRASAVVNFRILPGDTVDGVSKHVREAIGNESIDVNVYGGFAQEPSQVSDPGAPQFRALQKTIGQIAPDVVVAPYLVVGATDARYYQPLSPNVYRFIPIRIRPGDLERVHGTNERVAIDDFITAIRFYRQLMMNV
ncbi:MAG TPA: M20 family peptidase [Thermoanaerobaculia bacterium]